MKYTALNLLPIHDRGTIEFRHMAGTKDIEHLMTWINLILSLKKFALRNEPEYIWHRIETLNTTSEYRMFAEEVFGILAQHLFTPLFNKNLAYCITYIKTNCIKNPFKTELISKFSEKSPLYKYMSSSYLDAYLRGYGDMLANVTPPPPRGWLDPTAPPEPTFDWAEPVRPRTDRINRIVPVAPAPFQVWVEPFINTTDMRTINLNQRFTFDTIDSNTLSEAAITELLTGTMEQQPPMSRTTQNLLNRAVRNL